MRVAYLASSFLNPDDPRSWSGLPYFMRRALEGAGLETVTLRPDDKDGAARWALFLYWRWLRGKRYLRYCTAGLQRSYARQFERLLARTPVDAVFSPSTWLMSHLETDLPTLLWTDACFAGVVDFYPSFTNLAAPSIRTGHAAEQGALDRCAKAVYCSQWAADTARRNYTVEPDKIQVVPFGGNLQEPPTWAEVVSMVRDRPRDRCELLLVGVDWKRKGADIAIDVAKALMARGVETRLTIVGCSAPKNTQIPAFVEVIPFIGKEAVEGRRRLREIFGRSHFFVMPTRAEAFGLVFAEACAFGVPCLATRLGGLPSVIIDDVNGRLFPLEAGGPVYADHIAGIMRDPARYEKLALRAAHEAMTRLSWKISGRKVADLFESMRLSSPSDIARAPPHNAAEHSPLAS